MGLYVSSHYKNSPNDLMLMSDAPAHHLFVLLPPNNETNKQLPHVLCVIQLCLEGGISKETVQGCMGRVKKPSGDLIPWNISMQFQDQDFPALNGARIVRIATHPQLQNKGYGSRALELLKTYYEGKICNINEPDQISTPSEAAEQHRVSGDLFTEKIKPRNHLPPLLRKLEDRVPETLHYLGTSFGFTPPLYKFWKKGGFLPAYLRLTALDTTGEHTCVMLAGLNPVNQNFELYDPNWLLRFYDDFTNRFVSLLGYSFKSMPVRSAALLLSKARTQMELAEGKSPEFFGKRNSTPFTQKHVDHLFSVHDLKRLESFSNHVIDYQTIVDLVPALSRLIFVDGFGERLSLSPSQICLFLGIGLQFKSLEDVAEELSIQVNQVLALFTKATKKFVNFFRNVEEEDEAQNIPKISDGDQQILGKLVPMDVTLEEDLEGIDKETKELLRSKQANLLASLVKAEYIIHGDNQAWEDSTKELHDRIPNIVSVKRKRSEMEETAKDKYKPVNKKKKSKDKK
eukprot:TRINITY_DN11445_c0_g2_i2.p1 TRINITY_DN11445_c0_g2~~TRINITY_DN11445_c0_g2_i2.p1  ORF type:complete len:514 (+),score=122.96 TRINITY_DN11445_c0_g2_i2:81-1622(+)